VRLTASLIGQIVMTYTAMAIQKRTLYCRFATSVGFSERTMLQFASGDKNGAVAPVSS
jgi:hypothetical protein